MRAYNHEYPNGWRAVMFRNLQGDRRRGWCWVLYDKAGNIRDDGNDEDYREAVSAACLSAPLEATSSEDEPECGENAP